MGGGTNTSSEGKTQEGEGAEETCLEAKKSDRLTMEPRPPCLTLRRACSRGFASNSLKTSSEAFFFSIRLLQVRVV